MMMSNETMVDNETERNHKIIVRSVCGAISEISESGIPYYKDCRNMTEMGVRKPKRRLGKIVRNVRLKKLMGIKIGRLKKPILNKLIRN